MPTHNHIDLIEFPAADGETLAAARAFYEGAFGWRFTDYGEYYDTPDSGVVAGINGVAGDEHHQKMPLTVIYVTDLEAARAAVEASGGAIVHEIYGFPGGRRFHFTDPAGNELAVWSEAAS
ncbi:UNVERIFIED_CONTAM: VOC family protein [Microbacterium sp. SLM126]